MNPLFRDVEDLAPSLSTLARRAVAEYAPVVDALIRGNPETSATSSARWMACWISASTRRRCATSRSSAAIISPSPRPTPHPMSTPTARCGTRSRMSSQEHTAEARLVPRRPPAASGDASPGGPGIPF